MLIGVLALQGSVTEHITMLKKCNVGPIEVKLPEQLNKIKGLIIPGGESTTIGKLMKTSGIDKAIIKRAKKIPIWGTCAGAILLAKEIIGSNQPKLGLMDISIKRNSYGRQIDSFETKLQVKIFNRAFPGIFIRAPIIESVGNNVDILATFKNKPVMVLQKHLLVTTFHPELTNDLRIHKYFINLCKNVQKK